MEEFIILEQQEQVVQEVEVLQVLHTQVEIQELQDRLILVEEEVELLQVQEEEVQAHLVVQG